MTSKTNERIVGRLGDYYLRSCERILAQISRFKNALLAESIVILKAQEQLLRRALDEAEAQAWQTSFPHLVFPDLATERIQQIARRNFATAQ